MRTPVQSKPARVNGKPEEASFRVRFVVEHEGARVMAQTERARD